jgi:thiol-disulfide isomerase/thioredoxin
MKPNDKQAALSYQVEILGLQRLARLGEPNAAEALDGLVKQLRRDPREAVAVVGWQAYIMSHFQIWQSLDEDAKQRFQDELVAAASASEATPLHVELVQVVAQQTERADEEFAKTLLNRTTPIFEASKNPAVVEATQSSIGMTRRLNLPGNKLELSGTLLDGSQFDWEAYRGKVVLVDFWATWCGPCIMELPNVRAMYQAYHDRGFDVVGVSLDESEAKVESFIEENDVSWATLFPQDPEQRVWNNPIARYYGITGIPTAILVDRQGRAIEMNARDETLRTKLAELLGPPDEELASLSSQLPASANTER